MDESQVHIPDGWTEIAQLANLSKVYNGLSGKKKDDFGEGEPYIPYVNVFKNSKIEPSELDYVKVKFGERQNKVEYGDIIFTTSSETIEEVGMTSVFLESSGTYYLNSFCFILRLNNKDWLIPQFARYLFRSENVRCKISLLGQGSTRYNLSKTRLLKELKLVIPSDTNEQTTIARILSKVDEAIAQTEQLIAKYTRVKTGLMQDLLTKGIDEHGSIRSEETHEFKEEQGFKYPKEWVLTIIEKCVENIEQGWSPNCESDPAPANEWGILKTTAVTWNGYDENENKKMPTALTPKLHYEVKNGDVLITRAGPNSRVGVVSYVHNTRDKIIFSDKIYRLIPQKKLINKYLALALSSQFTQRHLSNFKTGMAESQTNISQKIVLALNILLPSPEEQKLIIEKLDKAEENLTIYGIELSKLKSLKTGLMQDLLSGKVRINHLIKETARV